MSILNSTIPEPLLTTTTAVDVSTPGIADGKDSTSVNLITALTVLLTVFGVVTVTVILIIRRKRRQHDNDLELGTNVKIENQQQQHWHVHNGDTPPVVNLDIYLSNIVPDYHLFIPEVQEPGPQEGTPEAPLEDDDNPMQPQGHLSIPHIPEPDPPEEILEGGDHLGPLMPVMRKPSMKPPGLICRWKRETLDFFVAEEQIIATRASKLGHYQAAQDCLQNISADRRSPSRRMVRSIFDAPSMVGSLGEEDIPNIEEIHMETVADLGKSPVSSPAAPVTPIDQRPKSFFQAVDDGAAVAKGAETDVSHGMFTTKTITPAGGAIEIYGVLLTLPQGAIKKATQITLGVLWTADHQPQPPIISSKQAVLSPVVCCEPHGLVLAKPASLTLPHCAHNVKPDWKIHIMESQTPVIKKPKWSDDFSGSMKVEFNKVVLKLDHFTNYVVIGETSSNTTIPCKFVELIALAPPLKKDRLFQIRVYCVNDYSNEEDKTIKQIKSTVTKKGLEEMTDPTKLLFRGDGSNLCLEIDKITKEWVLADMSPKKQEIDYDIVWHAGGGSCMFVLTSTDSKVAMVMCSIQGYQMSKPDKKQLLQIAQEEQVQDVLGKIDPVILNKVFPEDIRVKIYEMLDQDLVVGNNWVALAEHMDKPLRTVHWLMDMCRQGEVCEGRSPSLYLLYDWAKSGKTLKQFREVMHQMERHDIVDEIDKWQNKQTKK